jgi:hypothetical protein
MSPSSYRVDHASEVGDPKQQISVISGRWKEAKYLGNQSKNIKKSSRARDSY